MALTEIQQKWVDALRSGKYEQGSSYLKHNGRYCCLGVACSLLRARGFAEEEALDINKSTQRVQSALRLRTELGDYGCTSLAQQNDAGRTFAQIADIIESEPEGLFV